MWKIILQPEKTVAEQAEAPRLIFTAIFIIRTICICMKSSNFARDDKWEKKKLLMHKD